MNRSILPAMTLLSCAALLSQARTADACGGCFHGADNSAPSVVTGHRMALSLATTRTLLWDQGQYAGDPKNFAWVLPVKAGARIEQAHDAWFEALESVTATHVLSPTLNCFGGPVSQTESSGCGFG